MAIHSIKVMITETLIKILENPYSKKYYKDLKTALESQGRVKEAEAIDYLLRKRFKNETANSNNSEK